MSFLLQGNARSLSFNGEAKALSTPSSPGALGKPRVRKPAPPPRAPGAFSAPPPAPTTRMGDAPPFAPPLAARSLFPNRIGTPIPGLQAARNPFGQRPPMESYSDEQPTMALDREVLPPAGRPPAKPLPAAGRPIPNFRAVAATAPPTVVVDTGSSQVSRRPGAAWLAWLFASVILGAASYHYAPTFFTSAAAHASMTSHPR